MAEPKCSMLYDDRRFFQVWDALAEDGSVDSAPGAEFARVYAGWIRAGRLMPIHRFIIGETLSASPPWVGWTVTIDDPPGHTDYYCYLCLAHALLACGYVRRRLGPISVIGIREAAGRLRERNGVFWLGTE